MVFVISLLSLQGCGSSLYAEAGVGQTMDGAAYPEVKLPTPLGRFAIGVKTKDSWTVEVEHISSIPLQEEGKGLNTLWLNKRVWF